MGPNAHSVPQPGLDTKLRAGPLVKKIAHKVIDEHADPEWRSGYNPAIWNFPNGTAMPENYNFLDPGVPTVVNGRQDNFSVRMADQCPTFLEPPKEALFKPENIVIMTNGRCASACALFAVRSLFHSAR